MIIAKIAQWLLRLSNIYNRMKYISILLFTYVNMSGLEEILCISLLKTV